MDECICGSGDADEDAQGRNPRCRAGVEFAALFTEADLVKVDPNHWSNWTEDGTAQTCLPVPCPPFTEVNLTVTPLRTFYPEETP